MSYQSLEFLMFSTLVLFLYYALGKRLQRYVLLAANLAFFAISGIKYLPFILVTTLDTFLAGKKIGAIYDSAAARIAAGEGVAKEIRSKSKKAAKRVLVVSLIIAIGLLAVCKYTGFVMENVNHILRKFAEKEIPIFRMILPLGISFYTFMCVSYVLDIYWKRYPAEQNFLTYAVYATYFPHVVQGPIDRFNEFKVQIENGVSPDMKNLSFGAELALWGFFKKLVVADRVGIFVDTVISSWTKTDGAVIILAFLLYSVQIYADFSGCIDIVSGISEMFGIHLRKNFNHPYFAKTMGEFWRRWHISLSEWFKDYIYYPVSSSDFVKKTKKKLKAKEHKRAEELFTTCFPVLVVWMVTGIWHGAAWKYVAWGLFHAAVLIGSEILHPLFEKLSDLLHINRETYGWKLWQMTRSFFICCVGRIFFRAESTGQARYLIRKMILSTHPSALFGKNLLAFGLDGPNMAVALIAVIVLLIVDMIQEKTQLRELLAKENTCFRWILIFGCIFAVLIFGIYGPGYDVSSFIYEQF